MSRGMPSMTALLGLLALAGYQNRDKLTELLKGASGSNQPGSKDQQSPLGGLLGNLGGAIGSGGIGGLLSGGLTELVQRFKQNGHGDVADSWVNREPNKELPPPSTQASYRARHHRSARTADRAMPGGAFGQVVARAVNCR